MASGAGTALLLIAAAIALLLVLILGLRLQAFLSLLLVAIGFALCAGLEPAAAIEAVRNGMGGTLGYVATLVGLGAMFGALLEASGGIQAFAAEMAQRSSARGSQWMLTFVGFLVSIPVFFDVGLIILMPLLQGLARRTGRPLLYFGLPLTAGMMVSHAFIPPTPGPIAVADLIGADLAWVIVIGTLAGLPAMAVGGPLWVPHALRLAGPPGCEPAATKLPGEQAEASDGMATNVVQATVKATVALILLPLLLILAGATARYWITAGAARTLLEFLGHPFVALITGLLAAYLHCGIRKRLCRDRLARLMTRSLEPAGIVVLVTGAGGAFKQVLIDSGMGADLAQALGSEGMPVLLFSFLVTAVVRLAQGSATVAMITGAGLMAPLLQASVEVGLTYSQPQLAMIVIAIASGASVASHVNDSGFWLVGRYFGLDEAQMLKTFTTMTTLVGLTGFVVVCLLWQVT